MTTARAVRDAAAKRKSRASTSSKGEVRLPEPYTGSVVEEVFSLQQVPSVEDLSSLLQKEGIDTSSWGKGNTKEVKAFWKEIKLDEAGFEIWRLPEGKRAPVRVTHVLRAKVSSVENYSRGIFLFNTWQQYGDGRTRTRNGLLSEKLQLSEMPLERNLHEVCRRAVTEEEMQRVVDASTTIQPGYPAPEYDPNYVTPLRVVDEIFLDHSIEIEQSKSYPGLVTVYHLYTVDIICTGLPTLNFNTLEFESPDQAGHRKLKYIHAWVWMKFESIQRYLFEGSVLKERIEKGTFSSSEQLADWLAQFDIDLDSYGVGSMKSVADLWKEVEAEKTHLEHYGRVDGVPILMRVVHVLQVKLTNSHNHARGHFLIQERKQKSTGKLVSCGRHLATKFDAFRTPVDRNFFLERAQKVIQDTINTIVDVHFSMNPESPPQRKDFEAADFNYEQVTFDSYRYHIENSPSFKGMLTMYHFYTVLAVVAEGLPHQNFCSITWEKGPPEACVWRWVSWESTMDLLQAKQKNLLNRDSERVDLIKETASQGAERLKVLKEAVSKLSKNIKTTGGNAALEQIKGELSRLEVEVIGSLERFATWPTGEDLLATERLPPGLLSSLVDNKLVSDDFLAEVTRQKTLTNRVVRRTQSLILASIWDAEDLTGTPVHQASRFDAWADSDLADTSEVKERTDRSSSRGGSKGLFPIKDTTIEPVPARESSSWLCCSNSSTGRERRGCIGL